MGSYPTILRRYTDLPSALYLLTERKMTLLDPASWDDSNDSHYLRLYKERRELKSVLALCFTQSAETYHHWRIFSSGSSGVCICFVRPRLLAAVDGKSFLLHKNVQYRTLTEMRRRKPKIADLPFLKRVAFEAEAEFRIVFQSARERSSFDVAISLDCIERIVVSPWMPKALYPKVKATLRSIKGCSSLEVTRSTLIGNEEWKRLGDGAA